MKDRQEPALESILSFVRKFLVLPTYPINYFAGGTGRADILSKLYEYFSDTNIDNQDEIIFGFTKKANFLNTVKKYSKANDLKINRFALECFLWGLGILDLEEQEYSLDENLKVAIAKYISENYGKYTGQDFTFFKEVMARYSTTAIFFEKRYDLDLKIYINADDESKERIKGLKKPDDTITKLSELETLRLNKPEPARNSIDDIVRVMKRRRFMVRPSYQRKEVINPKKASSIIESVLLGITLPALFIYKRKNGICEVIDGQQRLLTLLGFMGLEYVDEKGKTAYSKNHKFSLRKPRILSELDGEKFSDFNEEMKNKIYDFQLYVVEIDENQNPNFNPIDLFIRMNDKPYPIRENSFEMWNSWADNEIIQSLKSLKKKLYPWFYLKQIKKSNDRDRMENEELLTTLAYMEYFKKIKDASKTLDIYQKTERINARISTKARISSLMQEVTENDNKKRDFVDAIKEVKSFIKKVKYVLLDQNKTADLLSDYLKSELDNIYKAGKESRFFRRTIQDFYFIWLLLESINFEMVKYHRIDIKKDISTIFRFIKNIPEDCWENSLGFKEFEKKLNYFKVKYSKQNRKTKLTEAEKLEFITNQGNKSSITGAPIFMGDDIEVDHTEPLAIGGSDAKENLGIAHQDENKNKGTRNQ